MLLASKTTVQRMKREFIMRKSYSNQCINCWSLGCCQNRITN